MRQADWGLRTVPPPTVPTSNDGIVQLNEVKKTGITTGKQIKSGINLASPQASFGVRLSRIHFFDKRTPKDVCGEARIDCFQAKVMTKLLCIEILTVECSFLCNSHKTLIKQKDSTSTQTGNINMWKKLSYLMYKSSLFGPHGSSNVIQLLLETHCAGS